ncbi:MAG: energy transducer TonB [Bacteroidota bacterium]
MKNIALRRGGLFLIAFLFIGTTAFSQTEKQAKVPKVEASYVGGTNEMTKFITANLKYPKTSKVEGKVYVEFTVLKDGSVTEVKLIQSLNPELDKLALDMVKKMPKWTPAIDEKDQPIPSKMVLPINFKK